MRSVTRVILAFSLLALATPIVAFLAFVYLPRTPTAFEDDFNRVQDGMTVEEVRGILGIETRETNEGECQVSRDGRLQNVVHGERVLVWESEGQFIRVGFVKDRAVAKHYFEYDL